MKDEDDEAGIDFEDLSVEVQEYVKTMSSPLRVIHKHLNELKDENASCLICKKPLGAESKDLGYLVCHQHRKCSTCSENLSVPEVKWCFTRFIEDSGDSTGEELDYQSVEITCTKCHSLNHIGADKNPAAALKQSEYDYMNIVRLDMIDPDVSLSVVTNENIAMNATSRYVVGMTFEQKSIWLKKLEACVAQAWILVKQDSQYQKNYLAEREKKHYDNARKESLTSTRPSTKTSESSEELKLGAFMQDHALTERKIALKIMRDRNKSVKSLMAAFSHMTEPQAQAMADKSLLESGVLKK